MSKLTDPDKTFMALVRRSPDRGEGWRSVSDTLCPMVEQLARPELFEIDAEAKRVRFSEEGTIVAAWLD